MDRDTFLSLIPAYALGALDAEEAAEFEQQLASDSEAQNLLADYQAVTQNMILATPVRAAPPHLGADLRRRLAESRVGTQAEATGRGQRPTKLVRRVLALAAILVVAFGVVWGLTLLQAEPDPTVGGELLYSELSTLDSPIRVPVAARENFEQISGELIADPYSNRAVLHVYNLPEIPPDNTYQLWLSGPEGVESGGLFRTTQSDSPTNIVLQLDEALDQYTGFGVSLEPAGGSPLGNRRSGPGVFGVNVEDI